MTASHGAYRCTYCGAYWTRPYCADCRTDEHIIQWRR